MIQFPVWRLIVKIWHSPTLMTWGNLLAKSLSLILLLPLVVSKLDTTDVVVWYLFSSLITLHLLMDLGFTPTFTRIIAYGMGGVSSKDLVNIKVYTKNNIKINFEPNWETIAQVEATMIVVYKRLSIFVFFLAISLGSLAVWKPISESTEPHLSWVAWFMVVITSAITVYGNIYIAYLQGINEIARIQRWQMFFSIVSIVTSSIILFFSESLFLLTLSSQSWLIANIIFNRRLRNVFPSKNAKLSPHIWNIVWPAAWRSGIGILMSAGLIQISGVIYAQLADAAKTASYLLGLQIMRAIANFSNAPFYSKIPMFSKLYAKNSLEQLIELASKGMFLTYWTFIIGFITFGVLAEGLLSFIGSNISFPEPLIWCLLGLAFFFERYGGMHIQLYSTSNHIIWHITTGIGGGIMILTSIVLFPFLDMLAFPLSILAGYLGFYSWYAASHSYKEFKLKFWIFERKVMLPPLCIALIYSSIDIYREYLC